jgi:hypothetical protein
MAKKASFAICKENENSNSNQRADHFVLETS